MKFELIPYTRIGLIEIGCARSRLLYLIGQPVRSFKRTPDDLHNKDSFFGRSVHVTYNSDLLTETIQIIGPMEPLIDGLNPVGKPFDEVFGWFTERDL